MSGPHEGGAGSPRVLLLASAAVIHARRWAQALAERGFAVTLASLEAPPADWTLPAGVAVHALPTSPLPMALRYPLALPAVRRLIDHVNPHLIDAHYVPNYGLLGALARRRPLIVNCWGSDLLVGRDPLRAARARFALARADRVFVDAENLARRARALGVPEERLRVAPWGVDLARFSYSGSAAARTAARAAWPAEWGRHAGPIAVSTRVLHPIYDVATVIRAWPRVIADRPAAALLIAGDGPERERLEALARAQSLGPETVRFLGRRTPEDLARLLAGADVYVSTSRSDSTSISLLEAMAAGAYPVVSDIDGNREWLTPDTAAWFPPGDDVRLADHLRVALAGEARLDPARTRNRATVEERGDWGRTMDGVTASYREWIAAQPSP